MKFFLIATNLFLMLGLWTPAFAEKSAFLIIQPVPTRLDNAKSIAIDRNRLDSLNLELLGELTVVDVLASNELHAPPGRLFILLGEASDFQAYLAPADKRPRLGDLVLGGPILLDAGIRYLRKVPMAVLVLSAKSQDPPPNALTFVVSNEQTNPNLVDKNYSNVSQINIVPLSFDDNPMDYIHPPEGTNNLTLIANFVRHPQ